MFHDDIVPMQCHNGYCGGLDISSLGGTTAELVSHCEECWSVQRAIGIAKTKTPADVPVFHRALGQARHVTQFRPGGFPERTGVRDHWDRPHSPHTTEPMALPSRTPSSITQLPTLNSIPIPVPTSVAEMDCQRRPRFPRPGRRE